MTLSYLSVTAPIAGRVGVVNTSNGNVVHAADTSADGLLTITNMAALRASFAVPESDLDAYGLPPEKWSSLKYGFMSLKEDENGRQETDI